MHPELLSSLAAERRRDLLGAASPALCDGTAGRIHVPARPGLLPRFRVSWSRTTLAAVGGRHGRSVIIVISATRTS